MAHDYPPPLDQLLSLGEPIFGYADWQDYPADFGLTREQVPDLIRMATDPALLEADPEDPAVYAPVHAWRALGELRAAEAVAPLLEMFDTYYDDDWISNDLPVVLAMIGTPAVPALEQRLTDRLYIQEIRMMAAEGLQHLAQLHPAATGRVVALLHRELQGYEYNEDEVNADIIASLTALDAAGALPTIFAAFQADAVETDLITWDDIIEQFGDAARRLWPSYE